MHVQDAGVWQGYNGQWKSGDVQEKCPVVLEGWKELELMAPILVAPD